MAYEAKRKLKKVDVNFISLVGNGANQKTIIFKSADPSKNTFQKQIEIKKLDQDQHMVYGIVYSPDEVDSQGDIATAEVIKDMAYNFMENGRTQNIDNQHNETPGDGFVAESWITKISDPTFPFDPVGSWAVAIKIKKDETWQLIKNNEITGLSMQGLAAVEDIITKAETTSTPMKTEGGVEFPAAAYAYVPEPDKPSTWKLRLWETPELKMTAKQVGLACAAFSAGGLMGNKVELPEADMKKIKAKIRTAWKKVNPDKEDSQMPEGIKKANLFEKIMKSFAKLIPVQKDFNGEIAENQITQLIWALQDSIRDCFDDETCTDKKAAITANVNQFLVAISGIAGLDSVMKSGKTFSAANLEKLKSMFATMQELINQVEASAETVQKNKNGDSEMTAEEMKAVIAEALKPVNEKSESLEKANTEKVEALEKANTELKTRLEVVEKSTPGSMQGVTKGEEKPKSTTWL